MSEPAHQWSPVVETAGWGGTRVRRRSCTVCGAEHQSRTSLQPMNYRSGADNRPQWSDDYRAGSSAEWGYREPPCVAGEVT